MTVVLVKAVIYIFLYLRSHFEMPYQTSKKFKISELDGQCMLLECKYFGTVIMQ